MVWVCVLAKALQRAWGFAGHMAWTAVWWQCGVELTVQRAHNQSIGQVHMSKLLASMHTSVRSAALHNQHLILQYLCQACL